MSSPLISLVMPVTEQVPPLTVALRRSLPAGTLLRVRASGLSMLRGYRVASITARTDTGAIELPLLHRFDDDELKRDWMWHIHTLSLAVCRIPEPLPAGTDVTIAAAGGQCPKVADLDWTAFVGKVASVRDIELCQVADPVQLHFVAGPPDRLEAVLKPDGALLVGPLDRYGNPAKRDDCDTLTLVADGAARQVAVPAGGGATEVGDPLVALPDGRASYRVSVVNRAGHRACSNALPRAIDGTPIYFGEFHWHTDFSGDGQRSLSEALVSARDELCLDFAGPADHMSPDGTYLHRLPIEQAEICRRFDAPGRFCTIPTAELSGRYGHANLVTADFDTLLAIAERMPYELLPAWNTRSDSYPLDVLSALCPEGKAMVVPHHTNMDSSVSEGVVREDGRPFWCAMHWPQPTPLLRQGVRLVEMVQNRGAFETEAPDPDWRVSWGGFGGSVQTSLARGHRIGFVGGTDNHTGWPTRVASGPGYGGLTAIRAPQLDGATLFDCLYQRRCYATTGARIVADATLNGAPIGSELELSPDAPREFEIRIHGTAPVVAVQIVSFGVVLADLPIDGTSWDCVQTWRDDRPGRPLQDVGYYVRARQADGHCVWLSPWWVDLA